MVKTTEDTEATETGYNRRSILKRLATAGSVTAVAGSGIGTAEAKEIKRKGKQVAQKYKSTKVATETVSDLASEILVELSLNGIIDTPSISEFETDTILSQTEYRAGAEGIYISSFSAEGEEFSARIVVRKRTQQQTIELYVHPEFESRYAIVKSNDDNEENVTVYKKPDGDDGVSPDSTCEMTGTICSYDGDSNCCASFMGCVNTEFIKYECPDGSCFAGSQVDCCGSGDSC